MPENVSGAACVNKCWDFPQSCAQSNHRCRASPQLLCEGWFLSETTWIENKKHRIRHDYEHH